jgi:peptidoglycan-associated lipoprotein
LNKRERKIFLTILIKVKMTKCYLLFIVCLAGIGFSGLTSCKTSGTVEQAKIYEKNEMYYEAIEIRKDLYPSTKKKEDKAEMAYIIGEDLRLNRDYTHAEGWYVKAINGGYATKDPFVYWRLGDVQKMGEKYEEALNSFQAYKKEKPSDPNVDEQIRVIQEFLADKVNCQLYFVDPFKVANSQQNDYCPVLLKKEGLVFTSDRDDATGKKTFGRTGLKYADLFIVTKQKSGKTEKWKGPATILPGDVNTDKNQGCATFDGKGTTMYYTDCNGPFVLNINKKIDATNIDKKKARMPNCVIKMAIKRGKDWTDPQILNFCTDTSINYGQPAISPDGNRLIFSMNGPGTKGGHDLYLSTFVKRGRTWSDPVNLGDNINTTGDEVYPYFLNDTTLYFSSDGWPGLGGLDLFVTYGQGDQWSKPKHLRAPLNSGGDDFGITFDDNKTTGYFTSNRPKSRGDDIYAFTVPPQTFTLSGLAYRLDTLAKPAKRIPLPGTTVTLTTKNTKKKFTATTDKKGYYKFVLSDNMEYTVIGKKKYYFNSNLEHVSTMGLECSKDLAQDLDLTPPVINLHNIYYDLDKADLKPESMQTLDSLYENVVKPYPFFQFEIGSHTDCRASYAHNDSLSLARAKSVVDYLVAKGIDRGRLVPHGYGEHQLVNNCACEPNNVGPGKDCTEAEHAANRRTTVKILRSDYVSPKEEEELKKEEEQGGDH